MKPSQRRAMFRMVNGPRGPEKVFIGFEGDPGTVARTPVNRGGLGSNRGLGGLSGSNASEQEGRNMPMPDGTFGPPMIYDEYGLWGTGNFSNPVAAPIDPSVASNAQTGPQVFDPGISLPFGISIRQWQNPTTMQSVPINSSTSITQPVLSLNMRRNGLVIQNNSTATAPDIAPTFWIGFNAQPQVGVSLSLAPGAGLLFDIITPRDSIYILPAGGVGASAVTQGVIVQATYAPLDLPH